MALVISSAFDAGNIRVVSQDGMHRRARGLGSNGDAVEVFQDTRHHLPHDPDRIGGSRHGHSIHRCVGVDDTNSAAVGPGPRHP